MKIKNKIIVVLLLLIAILGGGMSMLIYYINKQETAEINNQANENFGTDDERTNEEYIAVLLNNKEDFDYVASTLAQFSFSGPGTIYFYLSDYGEIQIDNCFSTDSQVIADEMLNNEEFYNCLSNLYCLNEFAKIVYSREKYSNTYNIMFDFWKYPSDYHGGLVYMEIIEDEFRINKIDEHWGLAMYPNV